MPSILPGVLTAFLTAVNHMCVIIVPRKVSSSRALKFMIFGWTHKRLAKAAVLGTHTHTHMYICYICTHFIDCAVYLCFVVALLQNSFTLFVRWPMNSVCEMFQLCRGAAIFGHRMLCVRLRVCVCALESAARLCCKWKRLSFLSVPASPSSSAVLTTIN